MKPLAQLLSGKWRFPSIFGGERGIKGMRAEQVAKAVAARISEPTLKRAAEQCGVSESTFRQWWKDPEARRALDEACRELVRDVSTDAARQLSDSLDTMAEIMNSTFAAEQVRLNAANSIVQTYMKLTERAEVLERIEGLERAAAHGEGH